MPVPAISTQRQARRNRASDRERPAEICGIELGFRGCLRDSLQGDTLDDIDARVARAVADGLQFLVGCGVVPRPGTFEAAEPDDDSAFGWLVIERVQPTAADDEVTT